jgi:hypothetical protein
MNLLLTTAMFKAHSALLSDLSFGPQLLGCWYWHLVPGSIGTIHSGLMLFSAIKPLSQISRLDQPLTPNSLLKQLLGLIPIPTVFLSQAQESQDKESIALPVYRPSIYPTRPLYPRQQPGYLLLILRQMLSPSQAKQA